MCHKVLSILSSDLPSQGKRAASLLFRGSLLFCKNLLRDRLLACRRFGRLCLGLDFLFFFYRNRPLRLGFFLGKLWSLEALALIRNLGNAHRGEPLAMAAKLFILFLAL